MKILFFGGCLFTTKTVSKDQRFINLLLSQNPGLEIDLARYASFSLVEEILSAKIHSKVPDVIMFLVRPFPYCILSKAFPRVPRLNGSGAQIKIHPGLNPGGKYEWFPENDRLIVEKDWNPNGTKRTRTHSINLKLGKLLGLDKWSEQYVKRTLQTLENACREKNIHFIVIGPPAIRNDMQERNLLVNLNSELRRSFEHYIDLFSEDFPDTMLGPDQVHYNASGHVQFAKKIEEQLSRCVSAVR